ncbi:hypothetical protein [Salinibacter phage M31CR41-2]|uniref:Uncharacterized protein n=2 Tax=Kairosalinivirus TaxID=2560158 RepID=A0A2I6UH68_9CAUD|nr:hypothetical protein FGG68_gp45 [Salinibacter phage M31CR41-2]YP_009639653.1 hypothetical protein FGG69_gp41 [Salinibacter phage SRUTV-1]ATU47049.1 hypothetical protein [Salinibacter phage SRUTV-1]AUO79319.1 hypothetical protein [Salinibacter phage M31CR41-2]AUO79389.1 hypothetical protein [Salinibacter virus M31CR41-3]
MSAADRTHELEGPATEGETVAIDVDPGALMLPHSASKGDEYEVEGRFEGPETQGVEVEMANGDTYTTFRIPDACYEVVGRE